MGPWGYVILAYGIVWSAIILYLVIVKMRLRKAETEIRLLADSGHSNHVKEK
jgi:CcmD family protein